jgi:hypothetical protein
VTADIPPGQAGHGNGQAHLRRAPVYVMDEEGVWRWHQDVDPTKWEVICPDCGDGGGRLEVQSDYVQRLRGPYRSKTTARRALEQHIGLR